MKSAKKIIELTGSSSKLVHKPLPPDDPKQRCPNIALAKEKLDWQLVVSLEEGPEKTIQYFDQLLKTQNKLFG